jgi:primary-amine oxidase
MAGIAEGVTHPLDPLTATEINQAAAVIRREHPGMERLRFPLLMLAEPPKDEVYGFKPGDPIHRRARATLLNRADGSAYEAVVSLNEDRITSWVSLDGAQPPILMEEFAAVDELVKGDERWRAAVARRGVTDFDMVQIDLWSVGDFPIAGIDPSRRLVRASSYLRNAPTDNGYAKPIENVIAIVDLNENQVLKILDGEVVPIPPESGNYDAASVGELRTDLLPLEITQPEGTSFSIEGSLLSWQRWSLRVSMHPTDGLVLHQVAYDDGGEVRPILYRAALSEMVVPYGDGTDAFYWRNAFDAGEYGMGRNMGSLTLGCDCLGEIHYLDTLVADDDGRPTLCRNVVCIHEEDYSILWKHVDLSTGSSEVRRSRRLVVSCIGTLGNYEYGFYWYFYQDGHMEFEVKLTGIVQTRALPPGTLDDYGTIVSTDLSAVHHQHIFNMRLDFDVDGAGNSVVEVDTVPLPPGEANPHLNAFAGQETLLASEQQAQRIIDPLKSRNWRIINPSRLNRFGRPVAYKLLPEASSLMLASPDSRVARRAGFAQKHIWVTPYHPDEMHAAGDYPNQSTGEAGLSVWAAQDRDIVDTDVVVWHTFGLAHIVRPEDWPIMPVERVGFQLLPVGFFDRNPSLDVAPPQAPCHADGDCDD